MTKKKPGSVAHPLNTFRKVIGGKEYDEGNYVYVLPQALSICIEFNSDYNLTKKINSRKNFDKKAAKEIAAIPPVASLDWFRLHGWEVPAELRRYG